MVVTLVPELEVGPGIGRRLPVPATVAVDGGFDAVRVEAAGGLVLLTRGGPVNRWTISRSLSESVVVVRGTDTTGCGGRLAEYRELLLE